MQNKKLSVQITTDKFEIISSGVVHLTEEEIKFKLGSLVIKYKFKRDLYKPRFVGEMIGNELVICLYNSDNQTGEGKIDPIEIGILSGKPLFTTWFVNTIEHNLRLFSYTFMWKSE